MATRKRRACGDDYPSSCVMVKPFATEYIAFERSRKCKLIIYFCEACVLLVRDGSSYSQQFPILS